MPMNVAPEPTASHQEVNVIEESELPGDAETLVDLAKSKVMEKYRVDPGATIVTWVHEIDWPDANLGCPQQGMDYAQVITPGYHVLLQVGQTRYVCHTDAIDRS